jgi:hypothetical protein
MLQLRKKLMKAKRACGSSWTPHQHVECRDGSIILEILNMAEFIKTG